MEKFKDAFNAQTAAVPGSGFVRIGTVVHPCI